MIDDSAESISASTDSSSAGRLMWPRRGRVCASVSNGVIRVSRKNPSTPSEYRSLRPSMIPRSRHSGAMYAGVPHTLLVARMPIGCMIPKSISLTSPVSVRRMFSALMSQWTNNRE